MAEMTDSIANAARSCKACPKRGLRVADPYASSRRLLESLLIGPEFTLPNYAAMSQGLLLADLATATGRP